MKGIDSDDQEFLFETIYKMRYGPAKAPMKY